MSLCSRFLLASLLPESLGRLRCCFWVRSEGLPCPPLLPLLACFFIDAQRGMFHLEYTWICLDAGVYYAGHGQTQKECYTSFIIIALLQVRGLCVPLSTRESFDVSFLGVGLRFVGRPRITPPIHFHVVILGIYSLVYMDLDGDMKIDVD